MNGLVDLYDQLGQFEIIDDDAFSRMVDSRAAEPEVEKYNYCPDCTIPMSLTAGEYHCGECGQTRPFSGEFYKDYDEVVSGSIRVASRSNRGRFYNISSDYTKTQMKIIMDQLLQNQSNFAGMAFPRNILDAAASQYNRIQKYITEDDIDCNGKICGTKKFVRRGNIKDETLAGLIYFEGIREKLVRKKKDIAIFMRLPTFGFSRGEDILRNLQAEGKIDIPVDEEPIEGYIDRYMDALGLDVPAYFEFVIDLVRESENRRICMNSQLSSKIVGAIWILINKCHLNITPQRLEQAADNTKRNTFTKFYNVVLANMPIFMHVFERHGISHT